MVQRVAMALVAVVVSACAARGPSPQVTADLGKAEALMREGCYNCLREAATIYDRLASLPKPLPAAVQGAFDTALLISIREKELGLPPSDALARARTYAARIPAMPPPPIAPSALVTAAGLVIGDTTGMDPEMRAQFTGRARLPLAPDNPQRRALDAAFDTNLVTSYVALAIDCEQARLRELLKLDELTATYQLVPLMRFRVVICGSRLADAAPIREADARWVDTLLFEGRRAIVGSPRTGPDVGKAAELFADAHAAFPTSFAITMAWANANQSLAEFELALGGFDSVLATAPTHRDAMLGRVVSLSYLMRHPDAIASATRLIELGTWNIADAYYWRAWNKYNLKDYEPAWDDVEEATKRQSNTSVYMLAGLIAYSRTQLPTAIQRFDTSFLLDSTNCDAVWMAGLVHVDQQDWKEASPKFTRAMSCFVSAESKARGDLANLDASNRTDAQKAKGRITLQKQIDTAQERAAQSAFNAAQGYARLGNKSMALNHIDFAAAYPRLAEKANALKAAIEKMPE
jgi:tetratricopeptide (TPR) repeat protein